MGKAAEVIVDVNHPRLAHIFHYLLPAGMPKPEVGVRVRVPLGPQTVDGWIIGFSEPAAGMRLREISRVVDPRPELTPELLDLGRWMADFYLHPLAEMIRLMAAPVKTGLRAKPPAAAQGIKINRPANLVLTGEQQQALETIDAGLRSQQPGEYLLHGVTGSGKTEVYLRAAAVATSLGRQVLYLVPEISLTPQAGAWFISALGNDVSVWHSKLSHGERYRIWEGIREGRIRTLIGARSAVFAPFQDLGLIIVDEEHDPSYKEHAKPYYHAVEVARQRSVANRAVLIMGSATPSLESYTRARNGECRLLTINRRPSGRKLPVVTIVDLKAERRGGNYGVLSQYLLDGMARRLERKEQVILFLNRRGYSPLVFCPECSQVLKCPHCSISLVYHRATRDLRCHYCDYKEPLPEKCPACGHLGHMSLIGSGVERVEQDLRRIYPEARLARLDLDSTRRKGAFESILGAFARGETDILLGTQMVTKGHDFPGVTLVGVLNADLALNLPDYRAAERTYQLLTQVAGRAGRGDRPGEVVVQSNFPEHYSIMAACRKDYQSFYREEAGERRQRGYPPFGQLIRIRLTGKDEGEVRQLAEQAAAALAKKLEGERIAILGPAPAPVLRVQGQYRWQLMLKGECLAHCKIWEAICRFTKNTSVIISIEVDPYGF